MVVILSRSTQLCSHLCCIRGMGYPSDCQCLHQQCQSLWIKCPKCKCECNVFMHSSRDCLRCAIDRSACRLQSSINQSLFIECTSCKADIQSAQQINQNNNKLMFIRWERKLNCGVVNCWCSCVSGVVWEEWVGQLYGHLSLFCFLFVSISRNNVSCPCQYLAKYTNENKGVDDNYV